MLLETAELGPQHAAWLEGRGEASAQVQDVVRSILAKVQAGGLEAVLELTQKFDGATLEHPVLGMGRWDELAAACPKEVQEAIRGNWARIHAFHEQDRPENFEWSDGERTLGKRYEPLDAVACYVPGGKASYPSTVLMTLAVASVAGVQTRMVVTPPRKDGSIDPSVAYAAKVAGATHIVTLGGAQAIAAAVLGLLPELPAAQAVLGPGNAYVTEAKRQLAHRTRIDLPAGPSELVVLLDDPQYVAYAAADLLAQAEHDEAAEVVLLATSKTLVDEVLRVLKDLLAAAPRRAIIAASLLNHGRALWSTEPRDLLAFVNQYAPEHLEILSDQPHTWFDGVRAAGSVFLGPWSPVSVGDYGSGTNHVLPTMAQAKLRGGLEVRDCMRAITYQALTETGLRLIAPDVTRLARHEGLHGHADAVDARTEDA